MAVKEKRNIRKEIHTKLDDNVMQGALAKFTSEYPLARLKAYANVDSIDDLRDDLRTMKRWAVDHIDALADEFQHSVEERGGKVFRAATGDDVKKILLQICAS